MQRITQVCANSTGAFGALKVDYRPKPIEVTGNNIAQDLKSIQPYLQFYSEDGVKEGHIFKPTYVPQNVDDEPEDGDVEGDVSSVLALCHILACEHRMRKKVGGNVDYSAVRLPYDADAMVQLPSGAVIPAHRAILAARSQILASVFSGAGSVQDAQTEVSIQLLSPKSGSTPGVHKIARLAIAGAQPLAVLILLHYLYTDELLAVWDRRIGMPVYAEMSALGADAARVKGDLQALARLLELSPMTQALEAPVRRVLAPTMTRDMGSLYDRAQTEGRVMPPPDVVLQLKDRDVRTHSVVLRARSALFASFFDLQDWSAKRWGADGVVRINMRHLTVHVMEFVLRFMCCGADEEMFRHLGTGFPVDIQFRN